MHVTPELVREVLAWHAWLDSHPEPAWRETATTAYLVEHLEAMGIACHQVEGRTGAVAELGEGPRWVAVRADLDAIWMGDVDGYAVHSCGHSAHMAAVLGAARLLSAAPGRLPCSPRRLVRRPRPAAGGNPADERRTRGQGCPSARRRGRDTAPHGPVSAHPGHRSTR